jgi:hypothetical protein
MESSKTFIHLFTDTAQPLDGWNFGLVLHVTLAGHLRFLL